MKKHHREPFPFLDSFREGWRLTQRHGVFLSGMFLFSFLVLQFFVSISGHVAGNAGLSTLADMVGILATAFLQLGILVITLRLYDGRPTGWGTLFSPPSLFFRYFPASLVALIIWMTLWFPAGILSSASKPGWLTQGPLGDFGLSIGIVAAVLGILASLFFVVACGLYPFVLIDKNKIRSMESFWVSAALTRGYRGSILLFFLTFFAVIFSIFVGVVIVRTVAAWAIAESPVVDVVIALPAWIAVLLMVGVFLFGMAHIYRFLERRKQPEKETVSDKGKKAAPDIEAARVMTSEGPQITSGSEESE